jgi:hypothetical protein
LATARLSAPPRAAFIAVSYAQCDDTCDGPEPYLMLWAGAGVGAGIGAAVGWIVDGLRRSDRRVRVLVEPTPKRKAVSVAFNF